MIFTKILKESIDEDQIKKYPSPIGVNIDQKCNCLTIEWINNKNFVSISIWFDENKTYYLKCWGNVNHDIETGIINNSEDLEKLLDWLYNKE